MPTVRVFDHDAVLAAVPPAVAVERTREAFERHAAGEWVMPAKVYVDSPPAGDFRAMPAIGGGIARPQVGDVVSRTTPNAASRSSPARCSSPTPRPAR